MAGPLRRSRWVIEQKPFRFFDLSPELRNVIYAMVISTDHAIKMRKKRTKGHGQLRALTQASHALRHESMGLFYALNTFSTHLYWQDECRSFMEWLQSLNHLAMASIKNLKLYSIGTGCTKHIRS